MLTILANIKIDSETKLQHLRDSFLSFKTVGDNWLINVRGAFREPALIFLREQLGDRMIEFKLLNDSLGWSKNALIMLAKARHDHVLIWNEDHLNVAAQEIYPELISEINKQQIDFMYFSWWQDGNIRKAFNNLKLEQLKYLDALVLTKDLWREVKKYGHPYYLISLVGIFKKSFLEKLLLEDQKKLPCLLSRIIYKIIRTLIKLGLPMEADEAFHRINQLWFKYRLPKYSIQAPFNLEKEAYRVDWLPFKLGLTKQELFACIDDDLGSEGYSLISRGLYSPMLSGAVNKKTFGENTKIILSEIDYVLSRVDEEQVDNLIKNIIKSKKIVTAGAGRVGMAARAFGMRLAHLGFQAYSLGDSNVPSIGPGDMLLAASGSGETQTTFDIVEVAKKNKAYIALITGNRDSRMGHDADAIVELRAPSKVKQVDGFSSIQPMTTLNEQCLFIFFDAVVLRLMEELKENHDKMWSRHSNLE